MNDKKLLEKNDDKKTKIVCDFTYPIYIQAWKEHGLHILDCGHLTGVLEAKAAS